MAGSIAAVMLVVACALLWWMTTFSAFRLFVWAISCAAFWPLVLTGAHREDEMVSSLIFAGLVWTVLPPLSWYLRRRTFERWQP